jgi:HEAT repeat protein
MGIVRNDCRLRIENCKWQSQFAICNAASVRFILCVLCGSIFAGCDALTWNARRSQQAALVDDLHSASVEARVAALDQWRASQHGSLPEEVGKLVLDNHPQVRRAAVLALAANRDPHAIKLLGTALADPDVDVRVAAISALSQLGGDDARELLGPMLDQPGEKVRAAAAEALVRLGDAEALRRGMADKAWQVRAGVAAALAADPRAETAEIARQLVADRSAEVQKRIVQSVAEWPIEWAIPVLLSAAESDSYLTSKMAAQQLASRWPAAVDFPVEPPRDANPKRQAELTRQRRDALAVLRRRWEEEARSKIATRIDNQVAQAQAAIEPSLDNVDRLRHAIEDLRSADLAVRRRAAVQLAERAQTAGLPTMAIQTLVPIVIAESDSVVYQSILEAVASDASQAAEQLVLAAMSHPAADVRRRACHWLEKHPDSRHETALVAALSDSQSAVTIAATKALAAGGRIADARPLVQLLTHRDLAVRLEAATTLARLGVDDGRDALVRLAHESDAAVRRQAALAVAATGDPRMAPLLIELLDDPRTPVQQAAVTALTQLTGQDFSRQSDGRLASLPEQSRRWKAWGAAR